MKHPVIRGKIKFVPCKTVDKMKIQTLHLHNFKRFNDLQIKNIALNAKLVLLIGANGSGKSAIFDAFQWLTAAAPTNAEKQFQHDIYYKKDKRQPIFVELNGVDFRFQKKMSVEGVLERTVLPPSSVFFGRPSVRIVPTLKNVFFDEAILGNNADGPDYFIEFDTRFQTDVKKFTRDISKALRDPLFSGATSVDLTQIAQKFIDPINQSLGRIFGADKQTSIRIANYEDAGSGVNEPPQLIFSKGNALIPYNLLSHGEKQVVILLLNFVVRCPYFQNAIYYIDEMDVHLNTSLQYTLLKEITENWIPPNSQLWTATHALGFIEYAKDADNATIIDLDNLDFDKPQVIEPSAVQETTIFEIAVPRASMAKILGNRKIVLCENKNYEWYSLIGLKEVVFTDVQNSNAVFMKVKRDKTLMGLRDRDFLTDNERQKLFLKFPHYKILWYYCFENYLYHPENLSEVLGKDFDKKQYKKEILVLKNHHFNNLVTKISESRKSYEEFRDGGIPSDKDISEITKALQSNDFETFFVFFSFKDYCGHLVHQYKVDKRNRKEQLVQTKWFSKQLSLILK
ncbi:MAG: hypothetical protein RLZZ628_3381 [Bacteroidota bacterium]|jgi:predicted ATPase